MNEKVLNKGFEWGLGILVPLLLTLTVLRLLLTPLFVEIEYRLPNFPPDQYGFTMEDRLFLGKYALDYLINEADVSSLAQLGFPDGTPLFSERELVHMVDVKVLVKLAIDAWQIGLGLYLILGIWLWQTDYRALYKRMLVRGGQLTILGLITLLIYLGLNFQQLFTQFHGLFFEGDSWLFAYSDTLIRLFPIVFWRDAFASLAIITILLGGLLWYFFRVRAPKSPESETEAVS